MFSVCGPANRGLPTLYGGQSKLDSNKKLEEQGDLLSEYEIPLCSISWRFKSWTNPEEFSIVFLFL